MTYAMKPPEEDAMVWVPRSASKDPLSVPSKYFLISLRKDYLTSHTEKESQ